MKKAKIYVKGVEAGTLTELQQGKEYLFEYIDGYEGLEVSRTMSKNIKVYKYDKFPPFFDGLLPEGVQLEGLLKIKKIDKNDHFSQLIAVGDDLVGVVTVKEIVE
ncbi:MAG: toxin HipA [Bacteroidetes bacterium GWE2_41_25]|nr:MAG: toxin HipA [Bacteroidetes bacterium GWA2_40_15]OFX90970.1 MAG: toxin HipA [Bacteroidetes bacterium GWE2_41_25]OFY00242.1 MAG: toxin HipA [Bacteroidetes bacterium GWC2_40_22]OFY59166.1 MAG: toxin HipA [Bacteroidetes bacterium GWF2_41_9]HBH84893.1 toxin HipA [Bacteroidales bacterium]